MPTRPAGPLLCTALLAWGAWADDGSRAPSRRQAPPLASAQSLPPALDLLANAVAGPDGGLTVDGQTLTIDPALQRQLTEVLKTYQTPWAAVVALEPDTGRVVAMAEHSEAQPGLRGLCTKAVYPAASVFKIVTAAALLEAGVSPQQLTCVHGGRRGVDETLLEDSEADARCLSFADAMGQSSNVVFAKLTARYLDPARLRQAASALRFDAPLAFPVPVDRSSATVPEQTLELASTGAGFGDVYLSPLHGAALAGMLARGGRWRDPVLFERDARRAAPEARALDESTATTLVDMLAGTVEHGTASHIFHERGFQVDAVGKTGSLSDKGKVFRDYSWFVGFAPRLHPKVAVAAIVVNDGLWRIKGAWLGREALRLYLERRFPALLHPPRAASADGGLPDAGSRQADPLLGHEAVEEGERLELPQRGDPHDASDVSLPVHP